MGDVRTRHDILDPVRTKNRAEVWEMGTVEMVAEMTYHP